MKRIMILFIFCIFLTGCSLIPNKKKEEPKKESVVTDNGFVGDKGWKETYIDELKEFDCESDNDGFTCIYHLVDIDDNGIPELIVKTGEDDETIKYMFFTYTNELVDLGELSAANINLFDQKKYLVYQKSSMGYESIYHLTLEDNKKINLKLVEENDYGDNLDNPYKNFGGALISYKINDYSVIERYK